MKSVLGDNLCIMFVGKLLFIEHSVCVFRLHDLLVSALLSERNFCNLYYRLLCRAVLIKGLFAKRFRQSRNVVIRNKSESL